MTTTHLFSLYFSLSVGRSPRAQRERERALSLFFFFFPATNWKRSRDFFSPILHKTYLHIIYLSARVHHTQTHKKTLANFPEREKRSCEFDDDDDCFFFFSLSHRCLFSESDSKSSISGKETTFDWTRKAPFFFFFIAAREEERTLCSRRRGE